MDISKINTLNRIKEGFIVYDIGCGRPCHFSRR